LSLKQDKKLNVNDTLRLLDDYKAIDENGHFETDN